MVILRGDRRAVQPEDRDRRPLAPANVTSQIANGPARFQYFANLWNRIEQKRICAPRVVGLPVPRHVTPPLNNDQPRIEHGRIDRHSS